MEEKESIEDTAADDYEVDDDEEDGESFATSA